MSLENSSCGGTDFEGELAYDFLCDCKNIVIQSKLTEPEAR